jgi:predicted nucleic acid-binding protein
MLVVADSSALVSLAACRSLSLLDALFQDVRIPRAVFVECTVPSKPYADELGATLHSRVVEIELADLVIAAGGLGKGELEAMALYKRLGADRLLVDDARARRVARLNGIQVTGSLGILLLAKEQGLVSVVRPLIEHIQAAGIRIAGELVRETLRLAEE